METIRVKTIPFGYSEVLDPEFCLDLIRSSERYEKAQDGLDGEKWHMGQLVSEMWEEHKGAFDNRLEYFAECSRVMNEGRRKKYFSDSGETLRRYVELFESYKLFIKEVEQAEKFIEKFTLSHLQNARMVYNAGKVDSPLDALIWCFPQTGERKSADEILEHYLPRNPPKTDVEKTIIGWIARLPKLYKWDSKKTAEFKEWADAGRRFFA